MPKSIIWLDDFNLSLLVLLVSSIPAWLLSYPIVGMYHPFLLIFMALSGMTEASFPLAMLAASLWQMLSIVQFVTLIYLSFFGSGALARIRGKKAESSDRCLNVLVPALLIISAGSLLVLLAQILEVFASRLSDNFLRLVPYYLTLVATFVVLVAPLMVVLFQFYPFVYCDSKQGAWRSLIGSSKLSLKILFSLLLLDFLALLSSGAIIMLGLQSLAFCMQGFSKSSFFAWLFIALGVPFALLVWALALRVWIILNARLYERARRVGQLELMLNGLALIILLLIGTYRVASFYAELIQTRNAHNKPVTAPVTAPVPHPAPRPALPVSHPHPISSTITGDLIEARHPFLKTGMLFQSNYGEHGTNLNSSTELPQLEQSTLIMLMKLERLSSADKIMDLPYQKAW